MKGSPIDSGPGPTYSCFSYQPHSQGPEPRYVSSLTATCEQDNQQVYRPGPAGQLHPIPSSLHPPQDSSQWTPDAHKHTRSWLSYSDPPQPGPSLHHRQLAAAPGASESLRLFLGTDPNWMESAWSLQGGPLPRSGLWPSAGSDLGTDSQEI